MKTKLILELGCNHQGNIETVEQMIRMADQLGAWAVKLQKRDIEGMSDELKSKPRNLSNSFGETYYEHRKQLELSPSQIKWCKELTNYLGMEFICTAFDEKSLDDLYSVDVKHIKLPSQLLTDEKLMEKMLDMRKQKGTKLLVSSGMHTGQEISNSKWIYLADVFFHCISTYPAKVRDVNLQTIRSLRNQIRCDIGYSSHESGGEAIKYAVLCGADYIERHFTLKNS